MTGPVHQHEQPRTSRLRGDRGSATSLAVVLLTPVFVVLAFAAFQAALWSHARTEARVVARDTAALVARSGVDAEDARASATAVLEADTDLRNVIVSIDTSPGIVAVTVTAAAPGIIRGTSTALSVTSAVPIEEISP
jgi:Flp pilus assembly protein TadG